MAVPAYNTDLVDIIANITSITGWTALGGGASGLGFGPDFAMQGTNAVDKAITASDKGQIYNGSATLGANTHIFTWLYLATAGLSDLLANKGLAVVIGSAVGAYNSFHVEGSDTYGAAGRVGKCYPVRYVTTATASPPYRTLTGSPAATPTYFGGTTKQVGTVKGSNLGISAIRYGTGVFITAGDVTTKATFLGMATTNDTVANRWGILTLISGSNYELQGRLVVGQTSAGTPTAAYFEDSNKNILIVDTPHSLTDFTQIIVDHASTIFNLTNISFEAAGTNNKGKIVYNNASTVSALTGCNFVKMGTSTLRAGVTANSCAWRQSDQVTTNSATITGCDFASSSNTTGALLINSAAEMALVTGCTFRNNAKAIKITAAGTYSFNGNLFSGNTVQVDFTGTGTCTINPSNGSTVSQANCVASGGGTIVVNAIQLTFGFNVSPAITGYEWRIYTVTNLGSLTGATEIAGEESAASATQNSAYSYTYSVPIKIAVQVIAAGYEEAVTYYTLTSASSSATINLSTESNI